MAGRKRRLATGRFDEKLIAARIESRRRQMGVEIKELCDKLGLNASDWSRKSRCLTAFSMADYERIAELLRAPVGWPFVDERIADALEGLLGRLPKGPADDGGGAPRRR